MFYKTTLIYCIALAFLLCNFIEAQSSSVPGLCVAEYHSPYVALQTFAQSQMKMPKWKTLPKNKADYQLFSLNDISVQIRVKGGSKKATIAACAVKFGENILYFSTQEAQFNGEDIPNTGVNKWFETKRKITHDGVVQLFSSGYRIHPHGSAEGSIIELKRLYDAKTKKAVAIAVYITMPQHFQGKLNGLCGPATTINADPDQMLSFITIETAKKYFVSSKSSNNVFYLHKNGAVEISPTLDSQDPDVSFVETKTDDQIMDDLFLADSKIDWEGITKNNGTYYAVAGVLHRLSKNILKHRQEILDRISQLDNGVFQAEYYLKTTKEDIPVITEAVEKTEQEIKLESEKLKALQEGLARQKAKAKADFLAIEEEMFILRTLLSYVAVKHEEQQRKPKGRK